MPEEDEDDADEEEPPAMLVDELKPIPLNCSNIEMYYSNVIIISLLCFKSFINQYKYLIARFSIFVHWI